MKKKNIIIIIVFIIIVIVFVTLLMLFNKTDKQLNFNEDILQEVTVDNGLILTNSKLDCADNVCTMTVTAKNSTSSNIDMSNYRISFLDSNEEEIYWYSGDAIGIVEANKEMVFSLELPSNLQYVNKIAYTENTF